MTTAQIISARILHLIGAGLTLTQAVDAVLGAGVYAKLASETYDEIRAHA